LQVATRVFEALDCTSVDGELRLVTELSTICYQGGNLASGITAWILLFVYLIGFPVWAFYIVKRSFHKGAHDLKRAEKYGYLYRNLKDYAYWFRTLSYAINFAIALQSVYADNASLRLFLVAIFLIFNAVLVSLFWPFVTEFANYAPLIVGVVIPVVCAFFIATQPQGVYRWRLFGVLVFIIVVAAVVVCIAWTKRTKTVAWLTRVSGAAEMPRSNTQSMANSNNNQTNTTAQKSFGASSLKPFAPSAPSAPDEENEAAGGGGDGDDDSGNNNSNQQKPSSSSRPGSHR